MQGKDNIEEFLSKRLEHLDDSTQPDWGAFEQKLSHAVYTRRMKRAIQLGTASVALIFLFVGVNFYERFQEGFYIPRDHDVVLDEGLLQEPSTKTTISPAQTPANQLEEVIASETTLDEKQKTDYNTSNLQSLGKNIAAQPFSETVKSIVKQASDKIMPNLSPVQKAVKMPQNRIATNQQTADFGKISTTSSFFADNTTQSLEETSVIPVVRPLDKRFELDKLLDLSSNPSKPLSIKTTSSIKVFEPESTGPYISPLQKESSWGYAINIYPNFTFRKFIVDQDKLNLLHRDFSDAVQAAESGGISLNLGFQINKRIGPVTYLNTGVEYISYKTEVVYDFVNFREANINKSNGLIEGYTIKDRESIEYINFSDDNIYHYINFPLSIAYRPWASEHIRLNIEAGGSFMYFAGASGQTLDFKTLDIIDLSEREFKNTLGSLNFRVGINYFVSKRVSIGFEPTLMYFTNTIFTEDYPFEVIPYSVGLNFNLQLALN
jgi:hypothetical protein